MLPVVEELRPPPDPAACCALFAGWPYRLFLDSAARSARTGRYSFLTADPVTVVRGKGARTEQVDQQGRWREQSADALAIVDRLLAPYAAAPVDGLPPFQGGAAGYVAYDWCRALERIPAPRYDDLALPDIVLGIYDWVVAWDHLASRAWLISTGLLEDDPLARARRASDRAASIRDQLRGAPQLVRPAAVMGLSPRGSAPSHAVEQGWWDSRLSIRSSFTHHGYLDAVNRIRDYIVAGDIFQANLSQRFETELTDLPWAIYCRLRTRNAAPFAAYLDFPDAVVLSASPERFFRVDSRGHVETRPIKGTRPRGCGPEHDAALAAALVHSDKDRAENLMIVDLMRNDLSRVCAPGSVRVEELFALEHFATVHHLVSTVVGDLLPDRNALDLLRASFPGGSITGAPKIRAMEIIAELEPSERSVYTDSVAALLEAHRAGADEAIFLDTEGHCSEATASNLFMWTDRILVTPPLSCGVLPGITREAILEIARDLGLATAERAFVTDELAMAEEAFLTSSLRGIAPLVRVGARALGRGTPGDLTRQLACAYTSLVARECLEK